MPRPLVSAIVSTYSSERFLAACLDDLESQTIADRLEIIVIDSGSPQNERGVVERYQRRFPNIVYRRTRRETLYAAWNRGIRLARGKYVTNANTDDAHRSDALDLLSRALEAHPEADLAYGDYSWTAVPNDTFDGSHAFRVVRHPPYHPAQAMFFCVTGCHPMWRRTLFDRLGWFDPTFVAPGDYEFFMRFAAAGLRAVHVPEVISLFFQNRGGLTYTQGAKEIRRLYPKYRRRTPIQRFYRVDPRRPSEVALAWVAQGNFAMTPAVPYLDEAVADWPYAAFCYERALARDPGCIPALRNLIVGCVRYGVTGPLLKLLGRLPPGEREALRIDLRRGALRLAQVEVPPAVEAIEFSDRLAPPRSRPRSAFVELGAVPARTRRLAKGIAGAGWTGSRPSRIRALAAAIRRLARAPRGRAATVRARRLRDSLLCLSRARTRDARAGLRPSIAPGVRITKAPDGSIVWDPSAQRAHYLNRSAALILELCSGRRTWAEIVELVRLAYRLPSNPDRAVGQALVALIDAGVLLVRPTGRRGAASRS